MVFEDLKAFIIVAEQKSFSHAAQYLCIAQSALSKRVQRLEDHVGVALLDRHARGVTLTSHGQALLEKARHLVHEVLMLEKNLVDSELSPSGEVCVAIPHRTAGFLVPRVIQRCEELYPNITLKIMEGTPSDMHCWVMQGEADIAINYSVEEIRQSSYQLIMEEPLYLFATPRLIKKYFPNIPEEFKINDLEFIPLILPKKPNPIRVLMDKISLNRNIKMTVKYELDGISSIRGMVQQGFGASIFGVSSTWSNEINNGELIAIPFLSPAVHWKMYLVRGRMDIESMAITKIYQLVHEELKKLIANGVWPHSRRA